MTKQLLLVLTAKSRAVFSERAATEGAHRTLPHPPGAALLGWVAGSGRYNDFYDPYLVFHSGKVRFSYALPLSKRGRVAYAVPQLLMEKKHGNDGKTPDEKSLNFSALTIGRQKNEMENGRRVQREPLKAFFVTRTGEVVDPKLSMGSRLRTAVEGGRAANGQLFGYSHLETDGAARYVATIEADDISDEDWNLLQSAFDGKALRLGRASGTFYGGDYEVEVCKKDIPEIWPIGDLPSDRKSVRVWALSDLALVDEFGAPSLVPTAKALGLGENGTFCPSESAISVRRYAPWNRKLASRDIEHQVIAAGSVLTFTDVSRATTSPAFKGRVGLWQEAGLGRIWLAPKLLQGELGTAPTAEPVTDVPVVERQPRSTQSNNRYKAWDDDPLVRWLRAIKPAGA